MVVTMAIPVIFTDIAYNTIVDEPEITPKCYKKFWGILLMVEMILYLIIVIFEFTDSEYCIIVGPNGHLDWAAAIRSYMKDLIGTEFYLSITIPFYQVPVLCGCVLYKPGWIMFFPCSFMAITFVIQFYFLGTEAYSVWCWTGSCLSVWGIFYPYIAQYLRNKYDQDKVNDGNNCCMKWLIKGIYDHYLKYEDNPALQLEKHTSDNVTV